MTDSEMNEAVARKLGVWMDGALYHETPDYCNSIEAAWEIVEFVNKDYRSIFIDQIQRYENGKMTGKYYWNVGFDGCECMSDAATAPRAICEAFLKLP